MQTEKEYQQAEAYARERTTFGNTPTCEFCGKPNEHGCICGDEHIQDEDCNVDPHTMLCTECGVSHAETCDYCGKNAFHADCPYIAV